MVKRNKQCKIPTDEQKILNAFMRTLLELQDDPDPETRAALDRDREMSEKCGSCD